MAKQRFVVYKAFNSCGDVVGNLMVAGGKHMPFGDHTWAGYLAPSTKQLMRYGSVSSVDYWKGFVRGVGACRFQKVIYFN